MSVTERFHSVFYERQVLVECAQETYTIKEVYMNSKVPSGGKELHNTSRSHTYLPKVFGVPIAVLGGTEMLTVLDGTVVALAIPRITQAFGNTTELSSWIITSYVLSFAGFLLLGGRLGDALGRKKIFITGLTILVSASLVTGFCTNLPALIICRVVQGFGAALAAPSSLAYVASLYAPGKVRSQAVAIYGAMMGLGSILGLTLGGLLADIDWRFVFWINVPLGVLIIIGAWKSIPSTLKNQVDLDYWGVLFLIGSTTGIILAISLISRLPEYNAYFYASVVAAIVLGILFVINEKRSSDPVIPISLLANKNRIIALIASFLGGSVMMCMAVYTAQFLQFIVGYTPKLSGLAVLPFAGGMGVAMVVSPILTQRIAPRWIIVGAGALLLGCFIYVSNIIQEEFTYFPGFFMVLGIVGFGVGLVLTAILLATLAGVAPENTGVLSALQKIISEIGGGTGLVLVGSLQAIKMQQFGGVTHAYNALSEHDMWVMRQGYSYAIIVVGVIAMVMGAFVLFLTSTPEEISAGITAKEKAESGLMED